MCLHPVNFGNHPISHLWFKGIYRPRPELLCLRRPSDDVEEALEEVCGLGFGALGREETLEKAWEGDHLNLVFGDFGPGFADLVRQFG